MRMLRLWLLALLLVGCAGAPPAPPRPVAESIAAFAFSGRIAVRQGGHRHAASIEWQHTPDRDEVLLATPLGQGIAAIERDAAGARLRLSDQRSYEAADWDELSAAVFGFRLPLGAVTRWLLGLPDDGRGWRVRVLEREGDLPNALPTLLEFERDDLYVRLKIDAWSEVR